MEVTKWLKPSISVSRIGDSASVKPTWELTLREFFFVPLKRLAPRY